MFRFLSLIILLMAQNAFGQNLNWVKTLGGDSGDGINCLKSWGDSAVIAGSFRDHMLVNGNVIHSNGGSDIYIHWVDQNGDPFQEIYIGNQNNEEIDLMEIDSDGNVYLAVRFRGNLTIGNQNISRNSSNIFIAKFDRNAQLVWLTVSNAKGVLRLEDMQLDLEEENLYLTGYYNDSLNWQNHQLYGPNVANSCIIKIEQNAQIAWIEDCLLSTDIKGRGILSMPGGKLWFLAEFRDSLILPNNDTFFYNEVHTDILLAQLDTNGQWISAKRWGGVLYDRPRLLRRSPDAQSFWIAGEFVGLLQADSLQLATAYRYYDLFWIKADSNGRALQAGQSMSNANSYVLDLLPSDQEIWLTGYFQDSLSGKASMLYSQGQSDAFFYRLRANDASLIDAKSFGGSENDQCRALAGDPSRLWAAGDYQSSSLNFFGSNLQSNGNYDGFYAQLNTPINTAIIDPAFPKFIVVKIIPNPSQGSFLIQLQQSEGLKWILYNLQGQRLKSGRDPLIAWGELPKGTYSLHIETDKGIAVKKVVRY